MKIKAILSLCGCILFVCFITWLIAICAGKQSVELATVSLKDWLFAGGLVIAFFLFMGVCFWSLNYFSERGREELFGGK